MEIKYIEAIIFNGNKILIGEELKGSNLNHFWFRCEIKQNENIFDTLKREVKEQLNAETNKIYEFNKPTFGSNPNYVVTIREDSELNSLDKLKIPENISNFQGFNWISLYDKAFFNLEDISLLRNLLEDLLIKNAEDVLEENTKIALEDLIFSLSPSPMANLKLLQKLHTFNSKKIDSSISQHEKFILLIGAVILGIFFERFFIDKSWNFSYTLFTFMFLGFSIYTFIKFDKIKVSRNIGWFTLIPIILLALTFTIYSNTVLKLFNILILPFLITASIILIHYENIEWYKFRFFITLMKRIFNLTFENFPKPFIFIKSSIKLKNNKKENAVKKDIIKGLLISLPILFIVIMLLTSADMVFNYYLCNISKLFENINLGKFIKHIFIIIISALYIFCYLWSFKYPYENINLKSKNKKYLSIITTLTVIILVNVVYLLFSIIQFSYLYGGNNHLLPDGFTYAEYARKGFFELVFVALINFILILSTLKHSKDSTKKFHTLLNISLSLLVFFTFNMLFSAHYKLSLYENTYGFTYLRIFVHIFMILLFTMFIITLFGIWNKKINISKSCLIISAIMYVFLNYINVDVLIAKKNIERYENTGKIDINYLCTLSYDAAPEILKLKHNNNTEISLRVEQYISDKKSYFNTKKSWGEFNISEYRAKKYFLK